jgi:hypothetical protein
MNLEAQNPPGGYRTTFRLLHSMVISEPVPQPAGFLQFLRSREHPSRPVESLGN